MHKSHPKSRRRWLAAGTALALTLGAGALSGLVIPTASAADAAGPSTAWSNGSFHLDPTGVVSRANLVLGAPNTAANQSMPLGNGALGVSAWAANGFTAQLNRSDTMPDRKSPGQVNIPGLAAITNAGNFSGVLDLTNGVLTETGGGLTAKIWVASDRDELIVDVTGADPTTTQTATISLQSGRNPTAAVSGTVGTLGETFSDTGSAGSGLTFGSLAAITASGQGVTTTKVNNTTVQTSFKPNADGSFRVVVAAPTWNGTQGDAGSYATTAIGSSLTTPSATLLTAQAAWWNTYWTHTGLIETNNSDGTAAYMENLRTLFLYEDNAGNQQGILPGFQAGTADMFSWNRDTHAWQPSAYWLWNLRGIIATNMSSGNYQLNLPIFDMYIDALPSIKTWTTQKMGGLPGICLPETMRFNGNGQGTNSCEEAVAPNWNALNISSGAELSLYIWEQYQATGDLDLLTRAYPFMQAAAQFLLAYQTVGTDGLLHSNANAHETQWNVNDPTTNITADLTLFPIIQQAAPLVGQADDPLVAQVTAAIPEIPPFPRTNSGLTQLLNGDYSQAATDAADATGTDVLAISYQPSAQRRNGENIELEPLWPWNLINDQNSTLFQLEQRSYTARPNKGGNDWTFDALDSARLENGNDVASNLASITKGHQVYVNGFADLGNTRGSEPYIEQSATVAATLDEALAQDYDGILRFAPAWPSSWDVAGQVSIQNKNKVNVQVSGGTLTTAAIEAGSTGSQKVKNPWPGQQVQVVDGSNPATVVVPATSDAIITVPLTAGKTYLVQQVSAPNSGYTYAAVSGTAPTAARHLGTVQLGLDVSTAQGTSVVGTVLGTTNTAYGLSLVTTSTDGGFDGPSTGGTVGGLSARTATNSNLYFDVDNTVAFSGNYTATVSVSYYDQGTGTVSLQYDDGTADPYKGAGNFTLGNTNTWKTATINVTAASFGGKEHGPADFRLRNNNGATLIIHSIGASITGLNVQTKTLFPPTPVISSPQSGKTVPTASTITGSAEPQGTVTVLDGTATLCTATVDTTGAFVCTPADPLSTGQHKITATVTDPTGLVSAATAQLSFTASDAGPGTATVGAVLGATNSSYGLTEDERPSNGFDGPTTASVVAGMSARTSTNSNIYFDVDDTVAFGGSYTATFTISYYDQGTGSFSVQYDDGTSDPYRGTSSINLTGSNTWKTATVSTSANNPAAFGGAQHSAADFRLRNGSGQITIHSVAVTINGGGVPNSAPFAPAPKITAPTDGSTVTGGTPAITGTSEPDATVKVSDGSAAVCTATADHSGAWTCSPGTALTSGKHTLVATATDPTATAAPASSAVGITVDLGNGETITVTVPEAPGEFTWAIDDPDHSVVLSAPTDHGTYLDSTGDLKPVNVTDTRAGAPTWSISGQLSDFTGGLSGKYLGWSPSVITAGAGANAGPSVSPGITTGNGLKDASVLASATAGHPKGTGKIGAGLDLQIPSDTEAGTYTATLTLTALG